MLSREFEPLTDSFWGPLLREIDGIYGPQAFPTRGQKMTPRLDQSPRYEVDETDDYYVISLDIPGVNRDDLKLEVTGSQLIITGERKSLGRAVNQRYGKFQRVFSLPDGVTADGVAAEYIDGVLRLAITKPATIKPIKIKIGDGSPSNKEGGFFKNPIDNNRSKDTGELKGCALSHEHGVTTT